VGEADRALYGTTPIRDPDHLSEKRATVISVQEGVWGMSYRAWSGGRARRVAAGTIRATVIALVALAFGASAALAAHNTEIVTQGPLPANPPKHVAYFNTIQAAVEATKAGDWVLIEAGVYNEEVKVTSAHSGIWIRGMNRNTVIIDGKNELCKHSPCPEGPNGLEVVKANNVYVENLTVRNFSREGKNGPGGNDIWWNGGANSNKIGAHGWWGRYLTAYDTGLNGGYGIFTNNETKGEWDKIYASGFNDSGMYLGACQECRAVIKEATMENSALGYSGSNSGGRLVIEKSIFRHNTDGIAPNGENPGDGPPPNDGQCGRKNIEHPNPTPHIRATNIPRCSILRENLVTENDNLTAPTNGSTEKAPWGVGIELPGVYAYNVENNIITNNPTNGILGFEYPNPFPPTTPEEEKEKGYGTIFFQLAGNRIANNQFSGNGSSGKAYAGDVTLEGGLFPMTGPVHPASTNNCLTGNTFADATYPAKIQEGVLSCANLHTPNVNPNPGVLYYLLELQAESEGRTPVAQPAPPAQETMLNPCIEAPKSPLCP
jgi:hypothetical protein